MAKLVALVIALCAAPVAAQTPRTTVDGSVDLREGVTCPDSLATRANYTRLCADSVGRLHFLRDNGTIVEIGSGGGGGGSMTGAEILAELLDVDGAASLLDADLLDGVEGAGYALVDLSNVGTIDADTLDGIDSAAFVLAADYEAADVLALVVTVDGAGSALDADTLDGLSSAAFALAADVEAGDLLALLVTVDGTGSLLDADLLDGLSSAAFALADLSNVGTIDADTLDGIEGAALVLATDYEAADVLAKILTVDGAASTLDADTLDGLTSADFALDDLSNVGSIDADTLGGNSTLTDAQVSDTLTASALVGTGSTSGAVDLATAEVGGVLAEANGGTGASSLAAATIDADTVDGLEGAAFALDDLSNVATVIASVLQDTDDSVASVLNSTGTTNGIIDASQNSVVKYRGAALAIVGTTSARSQNLAMFQVDENGTTHMTVYGSGIVGHTGGSAISLTSPTDTTQTPLTAGTGCRMSSASGATAWTPSESSAASGMYACCTNTGTNAITMTDVDGQYEGPGSVVGEWDTVCMEYVTDRWVERSFSNNEP